MFVIFVMFVTIVGKSTLNFCCIGLAYGMYWQWYKKSFSVY